MSSGHVEVGGGRMDPAALRAEAESRWAVIVRERPELEPAVAVQRSLVERLLALAATIDAGRLPRLSLPARYVAAKLRRGVPAFTGEPIPVPVQVIRPTLIAVCDELADGGAGDAARHIRSALVETRMDAGSLLTASLMRHQPSIRAAAVQHDLAPDLLWLVAELAVSPYAHAIQRLVFAAAVEAGPLHDAVTAWQHGDCPVCGSWPALAEVVAEGDGSSRRLLRCSFCAFGWAAAPGCVYCGNADATFAPAFANGPEIHRDFDGCDRCGSYLKCTVAGSPTPFPLLAIADLATTELDVTAMQRGYSRPSAGVRPRPGVPAS